MRPIVARLNPVVNEALRHCHHVVSTFCKHRLIAIRLWAEMRTGRALIAVIDDQILFCQQYIAKTNVGPCVTCCGWALLSDNDVRVMTSSLTPTSPPSVRQQSRKGEDVCEERSSLFCAPQRNHYSIGTVSTSLGCLFNGDTDKIAATGRKSFIVSLFLLYWCMCTFNHCFTSPLFLAFAHFSR